MHILSGKRDQNDVKSEQTGIKISQRSVESVTQILTERYLAMPRRGLFGMHAYATREINTYPEYTPKRLTQRMRVIQGKRGMRAIRSAGVNKALNTRCDW
jgi:hypothetical protein